VKERRIFASDLKRSVKNLISNPTLKLYSIEKFCDKWKEKVKIENENFVQDPDILFIYTFISWAKEQFVL
jgi:hypothetical protein